MEERFPRTIQPQIPALSNWSLRKYFYNWQRTVFVQNIRIKLTMIYIWVTNELLMLSKWVQSTKKKSQGYNVFTSRYFLILFPIYILEKEATQVFIHSVMPSSLAERVLDDIKNPNQNYNLRQVINPSLNDLLCDMFLNPTGDSQIDRTDDTAFDEKLYFSALAI